VSFESAVLRPVWSTAATLMLASLVNSCTGNGALPHGASSPVEMSRF
jgi:hypothetical protein